MNEYGKMQYIKFSQHIAAFKIF